MRDTYILREGEGEEDRNPFKSFFRFFSLVTPLPYKNIYLIFLNAERVVIKHMSPYLIYFATR